MLIVRKPQKFEMKNIYSIFLFMDKVPRILAL